MPLSKQTKGGYNAKKAKIEQDRTCPHCRTLFARDLQCKKHTFWCASNQQCPHCPDDRTVYRTPMPLWTHFQNAHQPSPCKYCDATIINGQLDAHMKECHPAPQIPDPPRHHERRAKQIICPWCTKACNPVTYVQHLGTAHPKVYEHSGYAKPEPGADGSTEQPPKSKPQPGADPGAGQAPKEDSKAKPEPKVPEVRVPERQPDHYATLGVEYGASQDEIVIAAKAMRIKVHPDRLKRAEGLTLAELDVIDERAKRVGWAAEVLCCVISREKYDRKR